MVFKGLALGGKRPVSRQYNVFSATKEWFTSKDRTSSEGIQIFLQKMTNVKRKQAEEFETVQRCPPENGLGEQIGANIR